MRWMLIAGLMAITLQAERSEFVIAGGVEKTTHEPDLFMARLHLAFLPGLYFVPEAGLKYEKERTVACLGMGVQYVIPVIFHPYAGVDGILYLVNDAPPISYLVNPGRLESFVANASPHTGSSFYAGIRIGLGKSLVLLGEWRNTFFPGRGWTQSYLGGIALVSSW